MRTAAVRSTTRWCCLRRSSVSLALRAAASWAAILPGAPIVKLDCEQGAVSACLGVKRAVHVAMLVHRQREQERKVRIITFIVLGNTSSAMRCLINFSQTIISHWHTSRHARRYGRRMRTCIIILAQSKRASCAASMSRS